MKIAFRLDADNQIGMGHAVRCSALAEAFAELGCECVYLCRENAAIRKFATECGLCFMPVPTLKLSDELRHMRYVLAEYDAVIIDSYFVSSEYIAALNRPGFAVVCYDDNALYEYSCDAVINGNLHSPGLSFKYGVKKPEMLLGGNYTPLRHEFRESKPIEIREQANRVLLNFGGSDLRNFTPVALEALGSVSNIEITIVLGGMTVCDDAVYALAGKDVRILKQPPSMAAVMRSCDIALTAGGSTVYELAALGIPTIVVIQADNQELIAEYLKRERLMTVLGDWKSVQADIIRHETKRLLSDANRRKSESAALIGALSRNGAQNAAERIYKILIEEDRKCR